MRKSLVSLALVLCASICGAKNLSLLNVSYDPTRELYEEFNAAFAQHWKAKTGETAAIGWTDEQTS